MLPKSQAAASGRTRRCPYLGQRCNRIERPIHLAQPSLDRLAHLGMRQCGPQIRNQGSNTSSDRRRAYQSAEVQSIR